MLKFSGERIVPEADNCEPAFALKMYQEHIARYSFAAQVSAGKRVLDVGCGVGYGSHLLARAGADEVLAFDISEAAVAHAREFYAHPRIKHFVGSAEDLFLAAKFDLITCFELIEHVNRQHRVLEQLAAALSERGMLVISTPRRLGTRRSAFHTRELELYEFSNLLRTYFTEIRYFFENNHFASLVTSEEPKTIESIYAMHPQFSLGQADYFVAVASHSAVDANRFRPQLVLNNDQYVVRLERDVEILHRIEDDLKSRIAGIEEDNKNAGFGNNELNASIAALGEENRRLQAEAVTLGEENVRLRAGAATLAEENLRLRAESVCRAGENTRLAAVATARAEENARVREELAAERRRTAEVEPLRKQVTGWQQLAEERRVLVESMRGQIAGLYGSASWRITAPLRRGLDVLLAMRQGAKPANPLAESTSAVPNVLAGPEPDMQSTGIPEFRGKRRFDVMYVIGCHEGESKRYRVRNLVESLQPLGYETGEILDGEASELIQSGVPIKIVVLFRIPANQPAHDLIAWCRDRKTLLIYDVDDLVFEPENIDLVRVLSTFSPPEKDGYRRGVEQYRSMLLSADFATCSTSYLAGRIKRLGKRAFVIPNSLNRRQIHLADRMRNRVRPRDGALRIGYFSGSNTHQTDFQACEAALLAVLERHRECRFVLAGILNLSARFDPYAERIERHSFMPYEQMLEVLATVDINLAPLEVGNPYCESKSQLKIFEAGLVGVPTIASGTGSYAEAIENSVDGFLANNDGEWLAALEQLIASVELRREVGERAHERALRQFGPSVVAATAAEAYGLALQSAGKSGFEGVPLGSQNSSSAQKGLKITWIVPGLLIGSGGHRNILRAAYYLERFGHQLELYFTRTEQTEEELAEAVRKHFYPLYCPMFVYRGAIRPTDVLFATHWSTVEAAVRAKNDVAGESMYFVQDFEPAFSPMGSEYVLAENTYRMGLYNITSGPWCEHILKREFGCEADHFVFPIDSSVYYPRPRSKAEPNIVFFAKPEMPRRCFELGVMALEEFHRLRPDVKILLFGSPQVDVSRLPFPAAVLSLLPTIEDLARLYSDADLGVVFSTTNPSLVPYEMMACGLPVVDLGRPGNEINYGGRRDIAMLADPAPLAMASQIRDLLENREELARRSRNGLEFVETFPSEEQMARRIEELILRRLSKRYSPANITREVLA
jgi:glycosyltransferase involved in cell wall biosynthesis/SAM-dependent methyltransferase